MTTASTGTLATTLPDLAGRHDVFLVDQFGVLHDGNLAYPGAIDALAKLKDTGAAIVLLSNSGKRSAPNEDRLVRLGFDRRNWDLFLSSGEVAWRMFAAGDMLAPKSRCLLISRDGDRSAVDGLDLEIVESGSDADVVLLSASEGDLHSLDHYRELLRPAAHRGVPLVCTNPDRIMLMRGGPRFGAGQIAELYGELGGPVTWVGKPYPAIYASALAELGNPDRKRVVGVGDSIEHDIAGAKAAGLSAALVRSGVLADLSANELAALYAEHDVEPDYVIGSFTWNAE